jgi:hypothetical protein
MMLDTTKPRIRRHGAQWECSSSFGEDRRFMLLGYGESPSAAFSAWAGHPPINAMIVYDGTPDVCSAQPVREPPSDDARSRRSPA